MDEIRGKVKQVAEQLITQYGVNEFWVGNYGNFDFCCTSVINELKEVYPYVKIIMVIPYVTKSISEYKELYYKKYDNILVADISLTTPKRLHIIKANEYMVNNSQFLICCIERTWGGAANTFEYAQRKKLRIFNVAKSSTTIIK